MAKLFKTLLVTSLLLYLLGFIVRYFGDSLYDASTLDALSWNGYGGIIVNLNYVWASYAFLFLYIVTTIGLLLYRPWARISFIVLTALSLFLRLFVGLDIKPAFESVLFSITDLMDGAIITLMYLTCVRHKFNKKA